MAAKSNRLKSLENLVRSRQHISIKQAAEILNVSEMTVRRDIREFGGSSIANINGVLVSNQGFGYAPTPQEEYELDEAQQQLSSVKNAICAYAATLIQQNDLITIDTGSTTDRILPHVDPNLRFSVLCYNLNILVQASVNPNIYVTFAGGYYHPNTQMFESREGIEFIRNRRATKVFLAAAGVHEALGLTCRNNYEVPTKRAIIASSAEHILVADSSKFGLVHSSYFGELDDIDVIVTDNGLSREWIDIIESRKIKLHIVPVN